MRKLVACLACRNQGTRLYGKPLQNLDVEKRLSILNYMISSVKTYKPISEIVLAISEGSHNNIFKEIAIQNNINYIIGDEEDVLKRLITSCESVNGTDIFRLTTESPFTLFEIIDDVWESHLRNNNDFTAVDNLPLGSGFEITKLSAYKYSWDNGTEKHRSELCSLYMRENKKSLKLSLLNCQRNY